jgi:hypothetical protein
MSVDTVPDDATALEPRIKALVAKRRFNLEEDFIDESRYDHIDERGHKISEQPVAGPGGTTLTIDSNLSVMYEPTPSTTSDVDMLRLEAEMLAEGRDLGNPHLPDSEETLQEAVEVIERDGNVPTWEVIDGE